MFFKAEVSFYKFAARCGYFSENNFEEAERAACGERPLEATEAVSLSRGEEAGRGPRSSVRRKISQREQQISEKLQTDHHRRLLNYAFFLLGRKNYTEAEMLRKLHQWLKKKKIQNKETLSPAVMRRLRELTYLNDDQFLKNYLTYRLRQKPHGKFWFLYEMKKRGIGREKAEKAWHESELDEEPLAIELLERKRSSFEKLSLFKKKQKIYALLNRRGFSRDTISAVFEKIR